MKIHIAFYSILISIFMVSGVISETKAVTDSHSAITESLHSMVVIQGTITGTVSDARTGERIPDARVTLSETDDSATTDNNGTFSISNLESGTYTVIVEAEGYQETEERIEVSEGRATVRIELQAASN